MADNVTAKDASGNPVTFATEDLGGGLELPLTKLSFGAHGTSTPVQDTTGNRLPVRMGDSPDGADVAQGATTDAAVTSDAAGTLSAKLRGLVKILASVWDAVNGRLKVDGSGVTQPVAATSLPLPANAAQEAGGNLATVAAAQGADGTGIAQPAGGSGIRGWLSGIYKAVTGTLSVSGTVSAASLPLPANAAQETGGNLAAVAATLSGMAAATVESTPNGISPAGRIDLAFGETAPAGPIPVTITIPSDQATLFDRIGRRLAELHAASHADAATIAAMASRFCARLPTQDKRGRYDRGYR